MALLINFWLVFSHDSIMGDVSEKENPIISAFTGFRRKKSPHLAPPIPFLPPFAAIENGQELAKQTINGSPTIAGIVAILNEFLSELHISTQELNKKKAEPKEMIESYFSLTNQYIMPLEKAFQGRPVFPIRDDDSIFISLAAFREHLLNETLQSAFENALRPDHLFIGAIVQNCFGWNATCKTGNQVIGKNDKGRDIAKISDAPPDRNGIEEFCSDSKFAKYCENGQIRVIYVQDIDAKGPAWARYFASKLWGGETYYMQMDSHLHFAPDWDRKYIEEIKAAKAYPKAVLSAYPPGFSNFKAAGNKGNKLCYCSFGMKDGEEDEMIRINTRSSYHENETRPTQIAFIAAGFFFARSNFLVDIPFDPYLPWCFMGEEIMLSMRAWTSGWGIYAPRKNLIAHQYRPVSVFFVCDDG